jgi:predicted HicB family RNase H-like nuclease
MSNEAPDNPFGSASSGRSPSKQPDAEDLKEDVSQEDMAQLNVRIPTSLHRRLKMESVETGRDMQDLAAEAIDRFLSD